jgi:CRP-like cAMP-binding protein
VTDTVLYALHGLGIGEAAALALRIVTGPPRQLRAGERLASEGDEPEGLHVVVNGMLKSCRNLDNGAAQTLALFTAGEMVGAQAIALGRKMSTLSAVPATSVATIPASRLKLVQEDYPQITDGLLRALARETAILQEWLVGMGRRTALSQVAHLLCEVTVRMRMAGRAHGDTCEFPLTQAEIADAAGLSTVHVNRVLQALRAEGLVTLSRSQLKIIDWNKLGHVADFDPLYLLPAANFGDGHAALLFPSGEPRGAGDRRDRQPVP